MRRLAILLLPLALAGCTGFLGGADDPADESSASFDEPGVVLVLENDDARPMTGSPRILDASGKSVWTGTLVAEGGASARENVPLPPGDYTVQFSYSWDHDGRAASGVQTVKVDTSACAGHYHVVLVVVTHEETTASAARTECVEQA